MLKKFWKDPYYLLKYFLFNCLILSVVNIFLFNFAPLGIWVPFSPWSLVLLPIGAYVGLLSATVIHNATHKNFRPAWKSRLYGELTGLHQLYGYVSWALPHLIHHMYPDDPERDPHPPLDLPFHKFLFGMRNTMKTFGRNIFLDAHGNHPRIGAILFLTDTTRIIAMALRVLFWLLLCGPVGFLVFYIPSYIAN